MGGCGGDEVAEVPLGPPPAIDAWSATQAEDPWPDEAGEPIFVPAALASHSFLATPSAYGQRGTPKDRSTSGTFGIGNGKVFGLIGLDKPSNTLTNAIGPGYQRRDGFFGDSAVLVARGGQTLAVEDEAVQRPRRTAVTRTLARSGGIAWTTTDFAPPGMSTLIRHVTVRNESGDGSGLSLRVTLARAADEVDPQDPRGLYQTRADRALLIHCPGQAPVVGAASMDIAVPALAPGEEWSTVCLHDFSKDGTFVEGPLDVDALLDGSAAATGAFLDEAMALETADPKVADLYENALVTLFTQTTESGIVSQMHRYTSGWLRDTEGAERLLLAAGAFERARVLLDTAYRALAVRGEISNSFDLEADLSGFVEPADPAAFWGSVPFMEKYGKAESPSYFPILHGLYLDHAGDASLLDGGRMAFLEACVRRQEPAASGLFPFSGDETFHIPMGAAVVGVPTSISVYGFSAHSSFLYAAAADRIAALGASADIAERGAAARKAADGTYWMEGEGAFSPILFYDGEELYGAPYEDVSLGPLWFGYLRPEDGRAARNVDAIVRHLLREDGTIATEGGLFYTGMVPGMFLANLAMVHRPEEEAAFDALDRVATPSGHFEELHNLDHSVFTLKHDPDGFGADISARYRSWEGGDVAAGMLFYLLGYRPDAEARRLSIAPHLPKGAPFVEARGLRMGDERFDLVARQFEEGLVVELVRGGGDDTPLRVDVTLHGARPIGAAWADERGVRITPGAVVRLQDLEVAKGQTLRVIAAYR